MLLRLARGGDGETDVGKDAPDLSFQTPRRLSTRRELPNFGIEVCVKILKAVCGLAAIPYGMREVAGWTERTLACLLAFFGAGHSRGLLFISLSSPHHTCRLREPFENEKSTLETAVI